MALKVQKLGENRRFHHVVDQLQEAILSGDLKPGDGLPSEMKLKEMFETGRGTIREALRMLEQKGLIDIRVGAGGGIFVRDMGTEKITEHLKMLIQFKKVNVTHIATFREGVEGSVAAMAAEKANKEDVEVLRSSLSEIKKLMTRDNSYWHRFIDIDIEIHLTIAKIAANPIYEAVIEMIHQDILGSTVHFSEKNQKVLQQNYDDLKGIVNAIAAKDAEKAKTLARLHVNRFRENIIEDI